MENEKGVFTLRQQFFIIGAQRCFTTWLENAFRNSPEFNMAKALPPAKEPKYFLKPNINQEEYEKLFYENTNSLFYGDKSVSYLESKTSIKNIIKIYPNCKMIICLRNPINRTLSHFFYNKLNNTEPRTLEEVFLHNTPNPKTSIVSMNPFSYIKRSQYSKYIPKFIKNQKNSYIVISESLPTQGIYDVYKFIGAKPPCVVDFKSINKTQWSNISLEVLESIKKQLSEEKEILEDVLSRKINEWI